MQLWPAAGRANPGAPLPESLDDSKAVFEATLYQADPWKPVMVWLGMALNCGVFGFIEKGQQVAHGFFQVFSIDHKIYEAIFQQKLRGLETFGQIAFDSLPNNTWSCETD